MHNIEYFFEPKSVAVVGASANPDKGGFRIVDNLKRTFSGAIYPINPKAEEIQGLRCYRSVSDIPGPVDLVIILIPNVGVPAVVKECIDKKVPAVIIESGGFADAGGEGKSLQDEIVAMAKGTGTRIWGPNCAGLINANPTLSTSFIMKTDPLDVDKGVAFISQSGMLTGGVYVEMITRGQPKIASTSTIGNRADVNESDLMEYLADEPHTSVITCYLESILDGRRFLKAVRKASSEKPIVALAPGRSSIAAQAAISHTGSIMGDDRVKDAVFRQYGVTRVNDFTEMMDFSKAFDLLPLLKGKRIAIFTHTGAGGVTATDLLGIYGLELAELTQQTKDRLNEIFPPWALPNNPIDIWTTIEQKGIDVTTQHCLKACLDDPNVDGVLMLPIDFDYFYNHDMKAVRDIVKQYDKPVVGWLTGEAEDMPRWFREYEAEGGIAMFRDIETAVKVLRSSYDYWQWRQRADEALAAAEKKVLVPAGVAAKLEDVRKEGRTVLTEGEAKEVLAGFGIPVTQERLARTLDEAKEAARAIGYPVVLKLSSSEITHKTEVGGVRTGIADEPALENAYNEIFSNVRAKLPDAKIDGILIAEMVDTASGTEVIVGISDDKDFGPTLLFGVGGIFVEIFQDISLRVAPISRTEARRMVDEIRGKALLEGARGRAKGDTEALVDLLCKVSDMAAALDGQIQELDMNPVVVLPEGKGVKALDALMVLKERN